MAQRFRVGFVAGVTPDRWARAWARRMPRQPLELVALGSGRQGGLLDGAPDGLAEVRAGEVDMCFVRSPEERDGLHLVPLYEEQPVVVVAADHPVAAYDEVDVADLVDEHLLQDPDAVPAWRDLATELADGTRHPVPPMSPARAVESVAAGAGVLVLPMSLARLHRRRDVVAVALTGVPVTRIGLAWPSGRDERPTDLTQEFVGVVRGRTAHSSRGR